jgi:hypothetical protein
MLKGEVSASEEKYQTIKRELTVIQSAYGEVEKQRQVLDRDYQELLQRYREQPFHLLVEGLTCSSDGSQEQRRMLRR